MNRSQLTKIAISSLLIVFHSSLFAVTYPPVDVDMKLVKVSQHVYFVQGETGIATDHDGFISNAAAIVTPKGVVIFDSLGTPSLAALFLKKIRQITDQPIVKVVASHYHADHIYGLQVFKELGAEIIAPEGYQDYLDAPIAQQRLKERRKSLYPWVNQDTKLVKPDTVISKTTRFRLGGVDFQINFLGKAHSDGDQTLLVVQDRVLLSGDLIFEGRIPYTGNADTRHWLELLQHLDNSKLAALIPGHGPMAKDPNAAIKLTRHYLKTVREKMKFAVDEMMDFDDAYDSVDWSEFEKLPAFKAANRQNVFGIYLSMEAESLDE